MSTDSLLPPNATPLETGLARLGQRLSAVDLPIADLWNPQTCPLPALPWLAWTLSVDTWDTDWTQERKRAITAGAIAAQRRKGSVTWCARPCAPSTNASNWSRHEAPQLYHTPRVRLPVLDADGVAGGRRSGGDRQPDRGRPVPRGAGALAPQSGDRAGPCRPRRGRGRRARRALSPHARRARCHGHQLGGPAHQRDGRAAHR
jgi:phage tail P2-like protein